VASAAEPHRCPSFQADRADSVVGVVGPDGVVGFLAPSIPVTPALLDGLRATVAGGRLEERYRFSGTCQQHACGSWRGDHCGVIEDVLGERAVDVPVRLDGPLAHCAIRTTCRWWAEHGRSACQACPLVHTATYERAETSERAVA
jgi:hypothetical protein